MSRFLRNVAALAKISFVIFKPFFSDKFLISDVVVEQKLKGQMLQVILTITLEVTEIVRQKVLKTFIPWPLFLARQRVLMKVIGGSSQCL